MLPFFLFFLSLCNAQMQQTCSIRSSCPPPPPQVPVDYERQKYCDCRPSPAQEPYHQETAHNTMQFRREVRDIHNYWRNHVAGGGDSRVPPASNMMYLNYDTGLELLARCCMYTFCTTVEPGRCDIQTPSRDFAINIAPVSQYNVSYSIQTNWFGQINFMDFDRIMNYLAQEATQNFVTLMWGSIHSVGCARIQNPKEVQQQYRHSVACAYCILGSYGRALQRGGKVYENGTACTKCPGGTKCESKKYPKLCGPVLPIPKAIQELPPQTTPSIGNTSGKPSIEKESTSEGNAVKSQIVVLVVVLILFI